MSQDEAQEFSQRLWGGHAWTERLYTAGVAESREILVIVATNDSPTTLLDFYDRHYRQNGWWALAPLAVVADIVTSPIQLVLLLIYAPR